MDLHELNNPIEGTSEHHRRLGFLIYDLEMERQRERILDGTRERKTVPGVLTFDGQAMFDKPEEETMEVAAVDVTGNSTTCWAIEKAGR